MHGTAQLCCESNVMLPRWTLMCGPVLHLYAAGMSSRRTSSGGSVRKRKQSGMQGRRRKRKPRCGAIMQMAPAHVCLHTKMCLAIFCVLQI
jgi:hypothetical protein